MVDRETLEAPTSSISRRQVAMFFSSKRTQLLHVMVNDFLQLVLDASTEGEEVEDARMRLVS